MCMWYVRGITLKVIYSLRSRSGKKTTLSGPQGGFRIPGGKLENKALAGKGSVTFPPQGFTVITTAIVQEEQLGRRGYSSVGPDWIPSRQSWTWRAVEKSPHWSGHCMVPVQTEISSPISEPFLCFPGVFYIGLLSNLHWHLEQSLNSLCLTGRHHLCRNNTNITHPPNEHIEGGDREKLSVLDEAWCPLVPQSESFVSSLYQLGWAYLLGKQESSIGGDPESLQG